MRIVVVKVGGSLLTLPDLAPRLRNLFQVVVGNDNGRRPLLVCGGGAVADVVREWNRIHELSSERSHWLAIRAMTLNESLLLDLLPEATWVSSVAAMESAWETGRIPVLQTFEFLRQAEPSSPLELPHTWDATSDSVAAWAAVALDADELVLVKSRELPEGCDMAEAARRGLVDPALARYVPALRQIRWANLRSDTPSIRTWSGQENDDRFRLPGRN